MDLVNFNSHVCSFPKLLFLRELSRGMRGVYSQWIQWATYASSKNMARIPRRMTLYSGLKKEEEGLKKKVKDKGTGSFKSDAQSHKWPQELTAES